MMTLPPKCLDCKYFNEEWVTPRTCEAFHKGIPDEIYFEGFDHTKAFKGDKGIRFEHRNGQ